jgi:glycosyltransferase involved in cell wall biosynthesis
MNVAGAPEDAEVDLLFDARHIRQSGIGTYISKQLPLLQEGLARHQLSLAVLADPDTVPPLLDTTTVVLAQPAGAGMYRFDEQIVWNDAMRRVRPRALWLPHYPFPLAQFRPRNRRILTFVTVHDTIHLLERDISGQSWPRRMYARTMLQFDAKRCSNIFAASAATSAELHRVAPSANVTLARHPVDAVWLKPADPALSPVPGRYLIYLGNAQRHKNLPALLRAYQEIAETIPQKLVIAGGGASVRTLDERIGSMIDELGDRVVVTGRLDFDALRALVAGADLLIMPSLVEGVGMPPLEAMASRTAVISSDIPALRETCGDGAEYFDPLNHHDLARVIRTYALDDAARAALAARGWSHVTERQSRLPFTTAVDTICATLSATAR